MSTRRLVPSGSSLHAASVIVMRTGLARRGPCQDDGPGVHPGDDSFDLSSCGARNLERRCAGGLVRVSSTAKVDRDGMKDALAIAGRRSHALSPEIFLVNRRALVRAALDALGVENLVLAIHDASFPSAPGDDAGRGSPYTRGAEGFFEFASELGFDAVQLGPQGETSPSNASPYDGSVFSKALVSLDFADFVSGRFGGLLAPRELEEARAQVCAAESRERYRAVFSAQHALAERAAGRLRRRIDDGEPAAIVLGGRIAEFVESSPWFVHDALFQAFLTRYGTDDWRTWPSAERSPEGLSDELVRAVEREHAGALDAWRLGQFALAEQHASLRARLGPLGLSLYGDLQIGLSHRDTWLRDRLFLRGYWLGAPPSRTNPDGQPWGYPVFDPCKYMRRFEPPRSGPGGIARTPEAFFSARVDKLFAEFDGVRIDHPHGLVCPWVYRDTGLSGEVQRGARLFESPDDPAHEELAKFSIVRSDQLVRTETPYADRRVRGLDAAEIDAFGFFFELLDGARRAHGRRPSALLCEVLSTCPEPLRAVMTRMGLGRFRVTQKASMRDPGDVYRSENSEPEDWIMVGNHDTEPLLAVVERWLQTGFAVERAAYLAWRLSPDSEVRERLAAEMASSARALVRGMFAELFASPARHVMVFFADLFGMRAIYNKPGVVGEDNWQLRVPEAYRSSYAAALSRGEGFDVPAALAWAMRARGSTFVVEHAELIAKLEALSDAGSA